MNKMEERRAKTKMKNPINTEVQIEHLAELTQLCGYCNSESPVCGGGLEGCDHPDNDDKVKIDGVLYGQCYPWACPIAIELDPEEEKEDRELLDGVYGVDGWKERLSLYMRIEGIFRDGANKK